VEEAAGATLLSSVLLMLEARRNLVRLARSGILDAGAFHTCLRRLEADVTAFVLRDLSLDLCDAAPMPAVVTPRSLDLAHLRTALWFHHNASLDRFVTMDRAQSDAARELGLPA
jgi:hypothetical protein